MRDDDPSALAASERHSVRNWLIGLAAIAVVLAIVVFFFWGSPSVQTTNTSSGPKPVEENTLETARQNLTRQTDLNTCRGVLQQINSELGEKPGLRPPALSQEQTEWLRKNIELDEGELKEIDSPNYTRLDGQHLDRCFLLRDAVRALEVKGVKAGGAAVMETPLEQATRAFAWVVRQVWLGEHEGQAVPPAFALRRGWGRPFERALVFLAMLEQFGDPEAARPEVLGCLLYVPGDKEGRMRFWACGVIVGDGKDVYLFDPRLGLPLPGPKGQGVATLAQVRKQPDVLAQLNLDEKHRYDVTAEQAKKAHALLVCPLSSLSPRMRHLQEKVLAPTVRVRLRADPAKELERLQSACDSDGNKTHVELARLDVGLLRRFLPPDEGGVGGGDPRTMSPKDRFTFEMVPWTAYPSQLQDDPRLPPDNVLSQRLRRLFAATFITPMLNPGQSRDLLLRGRYSSATRELVSEHQRWRDQRKQRANAGNLEQKIGQWVDEMFKAYAEQLQAKSASERDQAERQAKELWKDQRAAPVYLLLFSAAAEARTPEVIYQLGLCSQEQAEQLQARLDLQAHAGGAARRPADLKKAQETWQDALGTWNQFEESYRLAHPARTAVHSMRGRAEAMIGLTKAASATWKNLPDNATDLEKLAALYLARQLAK
jgi:hypothetical protein